MFIIGVISGNNLWLKLSQNAKRDFSLIYSMLFWYTIFVYEKLKLQSINQSISPYFLVYILQLDWPVDTSASLDGPV